MPMILFNCNDCKKEHMLDLAPNSKARYKVNLLYSCTAKYELILYVSKETEPVHKPQFDFQRFEKSF